MFDPITGDVVITSIISENEDQEGVHIRVEAVDPAGDPGDPP